MSTKPSKIINWAGLGRERFERIVEALIAKEFEGGDVTIPNGRGGDGGIDASVKIDQQYKIFQFKYFTDGFPSHNKSRRDQIRRSFKSALKHGPNQWILVIPENSTPSEYDFVKNLKSKYSPEIAVSIWGRTQLDLVASNHPEIVAYYNKDDSLERALSNIGEERHAPKSTADIRSRLNKISEDTASMDEDWTLDFSHTDNLTTLALRPKHPKAHEKSPVKIGLDLEFSPQDSDLQKVWDRHRHYGIGTSITLPARVIRDFRINGPRFLEMTGDVSHIVMTDLEHSSGPVQCTIETLSSGKVTGHFKGFVTRFGTGNLGISVELNFYKTVTISIPIPADQSPTEGDITLRSGEFSADTNISHKSARLMRTLHESEQIKILLSGKPFATLKSKSNALFADIEHFKIVEEFSSDIKFIESKLGVDIGIPEEISDFTRALARSVKLILDGYMTRHPTRSQFGVELAENACSNATISELLAGKSCALHIEHEHHEVEIGDTTIELGPLSFYAAEAVLEHRDGSSISRGPSTTNKAIIKTSDDKPMYWFIKTGIRQDADGRIVSSPWNIQKVNEA